MEFEPLFETSPHVIISERDPLAARPTVSLHELVGRPMVLLDLPATQDYFLNYFHAHGLAPDVQYRLKSFEMVRTLVGAGAGFSFGFLPLPVTRSYQGNMLSAASSRGARARTESLPGAPQGCIADPEPASVRGCRPCRVECPAHRAIRKVEFALISMRSPETVMPGSSAPRSKLLLSTPRRRVRENPRTRPQDIPEHGP